MTLIEITADKVSYSLVHFLISGAVNDLNSGFVSYLAECFLVRLLHLFTILLFLYFSTRNL